jgi:hypothetical protein
VLAHDGRTISTACGDVGGRAVRFLATEVLSSGGSARRPAVKYESFQGSYASLSSKAVARFVYLDEAGSGGIKKHPLLTLAAVLVNEETIQGLGEAVRRIAWNHLGWLPADFELHGRDVWHGNGHWTGKSPGQLIAAYEEALGLLDVCDLGVAYSSIDKVKLHDKYDGSADGNVYLLALQFLVEKVDRLSIGLKVLVADEAKEHELRAVKMVADMQEWGLGEVPGRQLTSVVDSLHFVASHASPGVQMADVVAFILQRRRQTESHPNAQAAIERLSEMIRRRTLTYRQTWP